MKPERKRNYKEPTETCEELKTLMRISYIPEHYSRVLKKKLYTLQHGTKSVEHKDEKDAMEALMNS